MQAIKCYVQEALEDVETQELQRLCETLRLSFHSFETRSDLARGITELVQLDGDTSLGYPLPLVYCYQDLL